MTVNVIRLVDSIGLQFNWKLFLFLRSLLIFSYFSRPLSSSSQLSSSYTYQRIFQCISQLVGHFAHRNYILLLLDLVIYASRIVQRAYPLFMGFGSFGTILTSIHTHRDDSHSHLTNVFYTYSIASFALPSLQSTIKLQRKSFPGIPRL